MGKIFLFLPRNSNFLRYTYTSPQGSNVYLRIREGVLEKSRQPRQQGEEGASSAQVCNNDRTERQQTHTRMGLVAEETERERRVRNS